MGCGKTTFAKEYAKKSDYVYIDFDLEYHKKIQKESIINPLEDIPKLLRKVSNLLNKNPSKNFIVDNWFRWHKDWWKDNTDNTPQELKKILKFHEIRIINLFIPFTIAYKRYIKKHKEAGTMIQKGYKKTMEERQKNLLDKISKWAIQ